MSQLYPGLLPTDQPILPKPNISGALGAALAQQQQVKQRASMAASALAHLSHPQTLATSPQAQALGLSPHPAQPDPSMPDPNSGGAITGPAMPMPAQPAAPDQSIPVTDFANPSAYNALIAANNANISNEQSALNAATTNLQNATATQLPNQPQYVAPTLQPANQGIALGAALAGLFAPGSAQGAIGAVGLDQQMKKDQYGRDVDAAGMAYKSGLNAYDAAVTNRKNAIDAANDVVTMHNNNLNRFLGRSDTLVNQQRLAQDALNNQEIKKQGQALTKAWHDAKLQNMWFNSAQRQQYQDQLYKHWGDTTGLGYAAIASRNRNADNSIAAALQRTQLSTDTQLRIANIRMATDIAVQANRSQTSKSNATLQYLQRMNSSINSLLSSLVASGNGTPQAQAISARLQALVTGASGQQLSTALQQAGVPLSVADEQVNSEADIAGGILPQVDKMGQPVAAGTTGYQAPGVDTSRLPAPTDDGDDVQKMLKQAQEIIGNSGGESTRGVDPNKLTKLQSSYNSFLQANGGDANKAWAQLAPHIPGSKLAIPANQLDMYRRKLQGIGTTAQKKTVAPASFNRTTPSLGQSLRSMGIPQQLLPLQAR